MAVAQLQNHAPKMWAHIEPYIAPGLVVTGVTFLVSQLWGRIAASCFLAVGAGVAFTFPFLITELSKGNFYLTIAQQMIIVSLPLFGSKGIIAAVSISGLLVVSKDIRIYKMRWEINDVKQKITSYSEKLKSEIENAKKRIEDFNKKELAIDIKLKGIESVDENIARTDKLLSEIREKRELLDKTLQDFEGKSEERKQTTAQKKIEIADMKAVVEQTKQKIEACIAEIEPLLQQFREALVSR